MLTSAILAFALAVVDASSLKTGNFFKYYNWVDTKLLPQAYKIDIYFCKRNVK